MLTSDIWVSAKPSSASTLYPSRRSAASKKTGCLSRRLERPTTVLGSPPVKRVIDGIELVRMLASRPAALRRDQLDMDLVGQAGADLVLDVEEVGALLLIQAFGP
jgi:hypothetical protein